MKTKKVTRDSFSKERKELYKKWIVFFRENPALFAKYYLGINLYPYQILMLHVLRISHLAYIVAARASAKSWLIAVWASILAILYPGIKIIIVAKTIKQGGLILSEKLRTLVDTHPNLAREIDSITTNANTNEATFKNGSTIKVVPSNDNSRGKLYLCKKKDVTRINLNKRGNCNEKYRLVERRVGIFD